jgi:hypothetical protein
MLRCLVRGFVAAAAGLAVGAVPAMANSSEHYAFCQARPWNCVDPVASIGANGEYTGHDEPSTLFYSGKAGSGNDMTYTLRLPMDAQVSPRQNGSGGTWNFQLHPAFWFGLAMCDTQSAPEFVHRCAPDSDHNARFTSLNPRSRFYIGKHPGAAFMEMQFYPPGWVRWPAGVSCSAHQWCAALNIDSLGENMNTGVLNNQACLNVVGEETVNFAFITRNGHSQAPANPLSVFTDPNATALTPNPSRDLMMNPGDLLRVHLHDTDAGFRVDITDLTTHRQGSMTASVGNGFGQIMFQPKAAQCHERPYAFHPMYSTSSQATRVVWAAHTYNVSYSDEIGHFELCTAVTQENGDCTVSPTETVDPDDTFCFSGAVSTLIPIGGCIGADLPDFDGLPYQLRWPGTFQNHTVDQRLHGTPVMFTSPLSRGRNYARTGFETDLPRIEATDAGGNCDRQTGQGCVNPPPGAKFYPLFTTTTAPGGGCVWQEGGTHLPNTTNTFGGSSKAEFGPLLKVFYPGPGFHPIYHFNDFRRIIANPCPAQG